ncbi:MAG TPA: FkbM family methyltransferase [Puia sp.]|nr:FkbM family methyltransferase [Puia sp.]
MSRAKLFANHLKHIFYSVFTNKKTLEAYSGKYNLKFRFHIKDGLGKDIYYKKGVYAEDHITSFLLEKIGIKDDDLIIDIGGNIGWYSLVLSYKNKPLVLAFEPDIFNFSLLKKNVALNKKDNIRIFNVALSDKPGKMTLYLYKKHNLGRHSFIRQRNSIGTAEVETIQLDNFLKDQGLADKRIKLIKIDIEGYEFAAMSGAQQSLARTDYLVTEFSPGMMKEIKQDPIEYINYIKSFGFIPMVISEEGLSEPDFDSIISKNIQVNLFCRKN